MIISRGRQYIFVHIPKTGGTALALALESRAMADDILIGDTPKAKRRRRRLKGVKAAGRIWKHATLADIDGLVTADELDQLFTFTLVRNPWDRIVSYYHWLLVQSFQHPAVALAQAHDFTGFLEHPNTQASLGRENYGGYMRDKTGVERCNLFIRLEHFAQDAAALEQHLGFSIDLPTENASLRDRDYRKYYNDDTAALVARLCAEDIARFDYGFGDFAQL